MNKTWFSVMFLCFFSFIGTAQAAETFANCTDKSGRLISVGQASTFIEININGAIFQSRATDLQDPKNFVIAGFQHDASPTALGKRGVMVSVDLTAGKGALAENGLIEFLDCDRGEGGP